MENKIHFSLLEICKHTGLPSETIYKYIHDEWIAPHGFAISPEDKCLDQEDLARIHFIVELKEDMGVNDEAIPVILRLVDQIHCLRSQISRAKF